ncbi:hypothetical protein FDM98_06130 [Microbacterium sp. TL13]|nr:hypothetical protein [Microbacterium sp. TL13]
MTNAPPPVRRRSSASHGTYAGSGTVAEGYGCASSMRRSVMASTVHSVRPSWKRSHLPALE